MKKNIIVIFFCLYLFDVIDAQSNCSNDSIMYITAYNFINRDIIGANQDKYIFASDSIVDLDWFIFSNDLIDYPIKKEKIEKYRINKKFVWFETFYSPFLNYLFCEIKKKQSDKGIIFFSQIEDNMLRADFLKWNYFKKNFNKYSYSEMSHQNEGFVYLFIFDEFGIIKATFSHEIIYD